MARVRERGVTAALAPARVAAAPTDVSGDATSRGAAAVVLERVVKRFAVRQQASAIAGSMLRWPPRWPREERTVLDGVSLVARRGECLGLLGPNGAGKTTIFRLIAGMVLPDEGEVCLPDAEGAHETPVVAYATVDERSLYWRLSAAENVRLYTSLHGVHGPEARRRIAESLERVGLGRVGTQPVGTFSSGMRQRLLVARALAMEPSILLLDEPTRSLDPMSARDLRQFLRAEVVGQGRCTVLLATHNGDEAMELCDRVAVLDRGRVVAVDAAGALARQVGDDRLRVWTTAPDHPAFAAGEADGDFTRDATREPAVDGWTPVALRADGGEAAGAAIVARLVRAGVPVSRVERTPVSLAQLIERVTAAGTR